MVRHQNVLVKPDTVQINTFRQRIEEAPAVMVITKQLPITLLPGPHQSASDMVDRTLVLNSQFPWHNRQTTKHRTPVNTYFLWYDPD